MLTSYCFSTPYTKAQTKNFVWAFLFFLLPFDKLGAFGFVPYFFSSSAGLSPAG